MPVWFQDHVGKQHASQELQEANAARLALAWNCHDELVELVNDFESYLNRSFKKYDLVVSNPPFYINSLESPEAKKNTAKHADDGFFESLITTVVQHLTDIGTCWLILPLDTAELLKAIAQQNKLYLQKTIAIKSYPGSKPHREMLVFGLDNTKAIDNEFVIYREEKVYSDSYINKLTPFFTIF